MKTATPQELVKLNEEYHKYLYLTNIESIEKEKQRIKKQFGYENSNATL
ncbi:hypothetical protein Phi19:1_gp043 [Cellulophaga phage phi19:1]|uniref:Uncharacterized protein n=1 Tax=Cellulophaga phage phi19:1 TaxID=1327970 RepID=R9ZZE7_9CAUD|nr:hypothetical protein Phi19:1_gp043 [Cellulophaga phage phi19:1]AGO47333.1 hypothetical protein Phi19:1_gp043 [Cellulophaga phage phi19:1]